MHDPNTVAFSIKWPIKQYFNQGKSFIYPSLVTIWHCDPEREGDEDSCGFGTPHLTKAEMAFAEGLICHEFDNLKHWFPQDDEEEAIFKVARIMRNYKRFQRRWWQHPKWHFWHWRIQIHPIQKMKRYLFSSCAVCQQGFRYGESPVALGWSGSGPRWFRNEEGIVHSRCSTPQVVICSAQGEA